MTPEEILAELRDIHTQLQQGPLIAASRPEFTQRLMNVTAHLRTAVSQAMADLNRTVETTAAMMRATADEIARKKEVAKTPPPAAPFPDPWEDHQGLEEERISELVGALVQGAAQRVR
jgi:hypothetical protein